MVKLNIVCVGIEGSNDGPLKDILCNLFPNDTRLELPHQVRVLSCYGHVLHLAISIIIFHFNDDAVS
jgi:hypothetical protein